VLAKHAVSFATLQTCEGTCLNQPPPYKIHIKQYWSLAASAGCRLEARKILGHIDVVEDAVGCDFETTYRQHPA